MDLFTGDMMKSLQNLLKPPDEQDDSNDEEEYGPNRKSKLGPGDIGQRVPVKIKSNQVTSETSKPPRERIPVDPDDIWDPNEVPSVAFSDDHMFDPRDRPEFDMKYKQTVRSEDLFLQMGNRTAASSSCELMVITINLPGEDKSTIDCTVLEHSLDIRSPRYRLHLDLPHPVREDQTKAMWNGDKSQLIVELTLNREWDSINF